MNRRHGEVNQQQLIDLEMARNEPGTLKCTSWGVNVFKSWCSEKKVVVDFKTIEKGDLNDILRDFYATLKNGKGQDYGLSSLKGIRAALNS